ncbi:MAG: uracil-DNA glycosylase [Burkholderiales bacterium]|nr:uracil-DNA glycosylase [Burkholderiales bacterium]
MEFELDTRQRAMLQEMGVRVWLPEANQTVDAVPVASVPVAEPVRAASPAAPRVAQEAPRAAVTPPLPASGEPLALQGLAWPALAQTAAACRACGLCAGRKHSTLCDPGQTLQADWMVVGDPPDEDEDGQGQPFAEQAGVLLDAMLKAVGARRGGQARQGAYLTNVVKCRPPAGRVPQAADLAQCAQFLQREIALVRPKVILAVGRFATQLLLQEHPEQAALPLGKQRGMVYRYQGIPVVVSYHPKVLLRASADKAKAWADLCLAMDVLEPPRSNATRIAAPRGG